MLDVHRRTHEERTIIFLNSEGQPIGPNKCVTEFTNFLGTVAKSPLLTPLNYIRWKYVPTKEIIWDYVKERYIIPDEGKEYVLDTVNDLWRVHKSRVKQKHYSLYATDEERLLNRPMNIPLKHFEDLLEYWNSDAAKDLSYKNKINRGLVVDAHTMGRSLYALMRHQLQQKDPNKQPPSQAKIYKESRKRVPGCTYKTNNEKTQDNIEKMNAIELEHDDNREGNIMKDPYYEVIAKGERHQSSGLFGRSVTKSKLKDKGKEKSPSYIFPLEFLQNIKTELIREIAPDLASTVVSQIEAANPGVLLEIPNFADVETYAPKSQISHPDIQHHEMSNEEADRGEQEK